MATHQYKVWFDGKVTIEFDTDDYPPRYADNPDNLAEDIFYDEATLRGHPFMDDSSEFMGAAFERML